MFPDSMWGVSIFIAAPRFPEGDFCRIANAEE
jgi:hypothetical protein